MNTTQEKFLIVEPALDENDMDLYVFNSPIEGWIFTVLRHSATEFDSYKKAEDAMKAHYKNNKDLIIRIAPENK